MNTDKATPELFTALSAAQGEIENAEKNSTNPHFGSRYANLAEVLNTIRPVFAKHGLSIVQSPSFDGSHASVTTIVAHSSGGFIVDRASCVPKKFDGQGIGDSTTYLRRYAAAAFAGIAQEDDDGESAKHDLTTLPIMTTAKQPSLPAQPRKANQQQVGKPVISSKTLLSGVYLIDWEDKNGISQKTGKSWTLWKLTVSNGGEPFEVSTFTEKLGTEAVALVDDQARNPVDIEVAPGRKEGTLELLSVVRADDVPMP